jgi:hypothetical protein
MKQIVAVVVICVVIVLALIYGFLGRTPTPPEQANQPVSQVPQNGQPATAPQEAYTQPVSQSPQGVPQNAYTQPQSYQSTEQESAPQRVDNSPAVQREQKLMRNQQRLQRRQGRQ